MNNKNNIIFDDEYSLDGHSGEPIIIDGEEIKSVFNKIDFKIQTN